MAVVWRCVLVLFLACRIPAYAQDGKCHTCGGAVHQDRAVFWGTKVFCGKQCKDLFWEEYQDKQFRCRVCNKKVRDPSKPMPSTADGSPLAPTKWDGLCDACRIARRGGPAKAGGGISASSEIEKSGKQPAPRVTANRHRPRPPPPEDDTGGVPTITWILFGFLAVLVGVRFFSAKRQRRFGVG